MDVKKKSLLFGHETSFEESSLVLIPVPWEVSVSYGAGSSRGPQAILQSSPQLDLYTYDQTESFKTNPIYLAQEDQNLISENKKNKDRAQTIIKYLETNEQLSQDLSSLQSDVNQACDQMVDYVYKSSQALLAQKKKVGVIGGDHSSPLGLVRALSETHESYDVLHIDAHLDLRDSYQGFTHSHASIMKNILNLKNPPQNLVSVGIRDYCREEMDLVKEKNGLISFTDQMISERLFSGKTWAQTCQEILTQLKNPTYISFDIDGLNPVLCPNTGTPVPGGLDFQQVQFLLGELGKNIPVIGFDLCEVSPSQDGTNEWDGNVGARILFLLYKTIFK